MHESFLSDPRLWVAVAFLLFFGIFYKKLSRALLFALDERAAKIAAELAEARRLREQAEKLLAEYKQKQADYLKEADAMLQKARQDSDKISQQAEKDLKEALELRMQHAVDKIAREEDLAIQEVRNHVVDIALAAARAVIVTHVGKLSQDELVKLALSDIERKIH